MDFKQYFNDLNQKINVFVQFVVDKLKNFKNLTLGEQISFGAIGGGLFLILTSFILFLI